MNWPVSCTGLRSSSLATASASRGKTFTLRPHETLQIRGTAERMRAYLCVRGGLQVPLVLGSRSAMEPFRAGKELPCTPGTIHGRFVCTNWTWNCEPKALRVLDGPQADWFNRDEFYPQEFVVTPTSNRMGLRLSGAASVFRNVSFCPNRSARGQCR